MPLPDVSDALLSLGDPLELAVIAKSAADFEALETITRFQTVYGVALPTQPRELVLLPEGERHWKYLTFYSRDTAIANDYYLQDDAGLQYRVVGYEPWGGAGYRKYLLQECPRSGSAFHPAENFAAEGGA